jgi:hypothetical protein
MAINLNSNISILAPFNLDAKYGVWSGADLATSKASALAGIPSIYRAIGMTVGLYFGGTTTEYWFKDGTADGDLVQKTSGGSTVSSGNLITLESGGEINFTGGTNTEEIIVENSALHPFIFTADDDVDALTFYGDVVADNVKIGFQANRVGDGGGVNFDFVNSTFFNLIDANFASGFFQFDTANAWANLTYKLLVGADNELNPSGIVDIVNGDSGIKNLILRGNPLFGGDINTTLQFEPLNDGVSFINYVSGQLRFSFNGFDVASFQPSATADFFVYNNMTVGANSAPTNAVLDVKQTGNTKANLRLTGITTNDTATLQFRPNATGNGSFIDYTKQLHFAYEGTDVARFGANTTGAFIQYFNMCVGFGSGGTPPSDASIDVYRTNLGGQEANIKLRGKLAGDNARLDFVPFAGSDGVINNSTNTKIFFWTNGSGTSYYDGGLFYFGSNLVQIDNVLNSNQSSLLIDPSYTNTGNSAITISGASTQASTRGLNIIHSYTGASSNAIFVGSAISASSNLASSVLFAPTLTATANNDYLIALDVAPTLVSGAFTGVQNTAIRTISGSNLFNTLSGNTIIGSGGDSRAFRLDVYGASRTVLNSNSTGAIATVTGIDLTYGLRVNLERSASTKTQFGIYSRVQGGATQGMANYGVYGESFSGGVGYGGYFVGNGGNSASRIYIGVLGEATNYNGTSTVSGIGGTFQVSTTITSGTVIPIIGNVISDGAPTGTLKYIDLRNAGTTQFFVERNANRNRPAMMIGGTTVDNSAIIQADSTTQGFLPPRMTGAQAVAISSPATGLIVYATSSSGDITAAGWWGYDGSTWVQLG